MSPRLHRVLVTVLVLMLVSGLFLSTGCKRQTDTTPGSGTVKPEPSQEATELPVDDGSTEPTATPPVPQYVNVYFARGEVLGVSRRQIPATKAVATAAMRELLLGTTGLEGEYGLQSEVPVGTDLLGISIANRVATVDLSAEVASGGGSLSMQMRVAQIVFTLTQFPTVDAVMFKIDGAHVNTIGGEGIAVDTPQRRGDYGNVLPSVLVESPTPGEAVSDPLRIKGMANTFEGTFLIEIVDPAGRTLTETFSSAGAMGEWKAFDIQVPFTTDRTGIGTLIVSTESAMDGSREVIVEIPIKMVKD